MPTDMQNEHTCAPDITPDITAFRSTNMQMNSGSTPVYLACQNGHLMTADYLAAKNGTPKIHTFDGMSPLHAAAQMGHLHIVKWLVSPTL